MLGTPERREQRRSASCPGPVTCASTTDPSPKQPNPSAYRLGKIHWLRLRDVVECLYLHSRRASVAGIYSQVSRIAIHSYNAMGATANAAERLEGIAMAMIGLMFIFLARFDDYLRRLGDAVSQRNSGQ